MWVSPVGVGAIAVAILTSCAPTLDRAEVEAQIQAELEQSVPLSAVVCPERVAIAPDTSFTCTGELDPQGTFPIAVTQTDEQGSIEWEVPNSKGLLNLATIESEIEAAIATETNGSEPQLDCGGAYRINLPGDSFECKVADVVPVQAGQTETLLLNVVVTLDPQGNVTWQQVRRQQTIASAATPAASPTPGANTASETASSSTAEFASTTENAESAVPGAAGQTAEDFLNNPGATDDF